MSQGQVQSELLEVVLESLVQSCVISNLKIVHSEIKKNSYDQC